MRISIEDTRNLPEQKHVVRTFAGIPVPSMILTEYTDEEMITFLQSFIDAIKGETE